MSNVLCGVCTKLFENIRVLKNSVKIMFKWIFFSCFDITFKNFTQYCLLAFFLKKFSVVKSHYASSIQFIFPFRTAPTFVKHRTGISRDGASNTSS